MKSPTERLLARRHINERGCWVYTGGKARYPHIWIGGEEFAVHRAAFRLWVGAIPEDMLVCHTCDNPRCFNPEHLFVGTPADNMKDKQTKGRCAHVGPPSHLTTRDIEEIRAAPLRTRGLAKKYRTTNSNIYMIRRRNSWKHV